MKAVVNTQTGVMDTPSPSPVALKHQGATAGGQDLSIREIQSSTCRRFRMVPKEIHLPVHTDQGGNGLPPVIGITDRETFNSVSLDHEMSFYRATGHSRQEVN